MTVRKADAGFRRVAFVLLGAAVCAGGLLLALFDRYQTPLANWIVAGRSTGRVELVFVVFAVLLAAPLAGMAAYLWSLGSRSVAVQEFPPPGVRVISDTAVLQGAPAVSKGRWLQGLAAVLCAAAVAIGLLLWWLRSLVMVRHA